MARAELVSRLDAIARAVSTRADALALLGLGSCAALERLDDFSDLDFFVIVERGAKAAWISTLDWLSEAAPLVWAHRNTRDGWKTLDDKGVLCEFAVFEPEELTHIPFAPGRVLWARAEFDTAILAPRQPQGMVDADWHAREALSNLLVGLMRLARGEEDAAWECICVHAATNALKALGACGNGADPFNLRRRLETRDPAFAAQVKSWRGPNVRDAASSMLVALVARFGEDAITSQVRARL